MATLFLEAAEDVDHVSGDRVQAGQVKALARPITLRSESVRSAVENFWDLRARNSERDVSLALLTTAARATEAGRPFGSRAGLDEWDRCRSSLADLAPLRDFLSKLDLGSDVAAFLRTASDDEVRSQLVRPIRWVTGQPDRNELRDRVARRVTLHGDPARPQPVTKPSGRRCTLRARLERRRRGRAPPARPGRASFGRSRRRRRCSRLGLFSLPPITPTGLASRPTRVLDTDVTPLVSGPVERTNLVDAVRERLGRVPALTLTGSSGMGKSTLAALVARSGGEWVRLDLRGKEEEEADATLALATQALEDLPPGVSVVVDDLPQSSTGRLIRPLAVLARAVFDQGGRTLVTAHHAPPTQLAEALGSTDQDAQFEVPALSRDELATLCGLHGCPESQTERWGRIVELRTSGHPQLAAAHARSLFEKGWGQVSDDDLFGTPPSLDRVQREARQRLVAQLPELGASDLAFRLSLYVTPFTTRQALRFAAAEPAIPGAGRALDILTGPWLERVDDEHFRVSPLLSKSYEHQINPDDLTRLHADAARSFLDLTLHPRALNGLLTHGLRGSCDEALRAVFGALHAAESELFDALAEWISWLAYAATDDDQQLYPADATISLFLRTLQVRVAVSVASSDVVVRALRAATREARATNPTGAPFTSEAMQFFLAAQAVSVVDDPEHLDFVIEQAALAARIASGGALSQMEALAQGVGIERPEPGTEFGIGSLEDVVGPLMQMLPVRVRSANALSTLLDAVAADDTFAAALQPHFKSNFPLSNSMTDGAWLDRFAAFKRGDEVDFGPSVDVLRRTIGYAESHDLHALNAAARRSLATVLYEHVKDREAAIRTLNDGPASRPELAEYEAKMLYMDGDPSAAVDLYHKILPMWTSGVGRANTPRAYAYQDAIRAAGEADRLLDALAFAELAIEVADVELEGIQSPLPIGFRADRAYTLYRLGRLPEAVTAYADVLERLDEAPAQQGFGVLRGRVGHTLVLIEHRIRRLPDPEGFHPPFVGLFSKPEPDYADYEAPAGPVMIWGRLAHLELLVTRDRSVSERFMQLSQGKAELLILHDRAQHQFARAVLSGSPNLLGLADESFRCAARGAGARADSPFSVDLAQTAIGLAVIQASADRRIAGLPVDAWSRQAALLLGSDAPGLRLMEQWQQMVQLAAKLERGTRRAAPPLNQRMIDSASPPFVRVTAAAALALYSSDPDTRFYARATVFQFAQPRAFSEYVERAVSAMVVSDASAGYPEAAQSILAVQSRVTLSEEVRLYFQGIAET